MYKRILEPRLFTVNDDQSFLEVNNSAYSIIIHVSVILGCLLIQTNQKYDSNAKSRRYCRWRYQWYSESDFWQVIQRNNSNTIIVISFIRIPLYHHLLHPIRFLQFVRESNGVPSKRSVQSRNELFLRLTRSNMREHPCYYNPDGCF